MGTCEVIVRAVHGYFILLTSLYVTQKSSTKISCHGHSPKSSLILLRFQLAWQNICFRFENKRILVNNQLNVLFNLPLLGDISSCIDTLSMYEIDARSLDPIFIFLCSNRLLDSKLTLWEQNNLKKSYSRADLSRQSVSFT